MDGQPQTFFIGQHKPFEVGCEVRQEIVGDRLCLTVTPYVRTSEPKKAPLSQTVRHQRFKPKG